MKRIDPYQTTTVILLIAIVVAVGFFIYNLAKGQFGKAALSVDSVYSEATVLVNGKDKGQTPVYTEEVSAGNLEVKMSNDTNTYSTIIKPAIGTLAVVKRDLGVTDTFSSGQNIWFSKAPGDESVISVISPDTDLVSVIVGGVEMGKTPVRFSTEEFLEQNDEDKYSLIFRKDGYEDQEIEVKVKPGYELNIRVDMFLKPIPSDIDILNGLPESITFIDFSQVSDPSFTDRQSWAKAVNYWLSTRGPAVFGNNRVEEFTYLISDGGKIYNSEGNEITSSDSDFTQNVYVAYLSDNSASELSEDAKSVIAEALGQEVEVTSGGSEVAPSSDEGGTLIILPTGIGFLRVRSGPGTGNAEVAQVDVGESFPYSSENNGWYEIEYEDGSSGWISGTYAEIE